MKSTEGIEQIAQDLNTKFGLVGGGSFKVAYIGNVEGKTDYRTWYFFAPTGGREGTALDRWGGESTPENLEARANKFNDSLYRWAQLRLDRLNHERRSKTINKCDNCTSPIDRANHKTITWKIRNEPDVTLNVCFECLADETLINDDQARATRIWATK